MAAPALLLNLAPAPLLFQLTRPWAPPRGARILVAASGGADSTALLLLLAGLAAGRGWTLSVATLDHGLRGATGAADARFVADLAHELRAPVEVARRPVVSVPGQSLETAARETRLSFLREAARRCDAAAVALGHTLDDQAETVLHRIGRGAGLTGLAAMRRFAPPFWRPLLGVRRELLRRLLEQAHAPWREDETNRSAHAMRNRIRGGLLPVFESVLGPGATAALARLAALAAEDDDFLNDVARSHVDQVVQAAAPQRLELDGRALSRLAPAVSRRVLRCCVERLTGERPRLAAVHLLALDSLARAETPGNRATLPGGLTAQRKRRVVILELLERRGGG